MVALMHKYCTALRVCFSVCFSAPAQWLILPWAISSKSPPSVMCLRALDCSVCPLACNPLHVSPSSGVRCPPLPCNPYSVSQLWTAVSTSALQSFACVSRLWTALSASRLQSFACVSQLWAAVFASAFQSL